MLPYTIELIRKMAANRKEEKTPSKCGKYFGTTSAVSLRTHYDDDNEICRKLRGNSRVTWCELQSGGLTPKQLLAKARR